MKNTYKRGSVVFLSFLIIIMIALLCNVILYAMPSVAYAAETNDAINYDTYTDSKTFTWNGTQWRSLDSLVSEGSGDLIVSVHTGTSYLALWSYDYGYLDLKILAE